MITGSPKHFNKRISRLYRSIPIVEISDSNFTQAVNDKLVNFNVCHCGIYSFNVIKDRTFTLCQGGTNINYEIIDCRRCNLRANINTLTVKPPLQSLSGSV